VVSAAARLTRQSAVTCSSSPEKRRLPQKTKGAGCLSPTSAASPSVPGFRSVRALHAANWHSTTASYYLSFSRLLPLDIASSAGTSMGSPSAPTQLALLLDFLLAIPWSGAESRSAGGGYRVVSVSRSKDLLSARLELAGGGEKPELGPDIQRLSLTARQVRSPWIN
jgi:hypothetical protein